MTAPTAEHTRHEDHCKVCEVCSEGGQCREARDLLRDADSADWRIVLAPARERATVLQAV